VKNKKAPMKQMDLGMLPDDFWRGLCESLRAIDQAVEGKLKVVVPAKPVWLHGICWGKVAICGRWDIVRGDRHSTVGMNLPLFGMDPRVMWMVNGNQKDQETAFNAYINLFTAGKKYSLDKYLRSC
jgi:hypothetical protein